MSHCVSLDPHDGPRCPSHVHNHATCARCGGPACRACDRCHGCAQLVCPACDTDTGQPAFAWPGDAQAHPHVEPAI